jgi:anaerobic magnesium-protoporphyrin IX monomethyl ester cyclase
MKILFVNPHYPHDPYTLLLHPPLCYGYMASLLKPAGHQVYHADLPFYGNTAESLLPFLDSLKPDLVGVTCVAQSYCQALEISRFVKNWKADLPVAIGGPHVSFIPREALTRHPSLDYVVLFDGEQPMLDLANALDARATTEQLAKIAGLAFRAEGTVVVKQPMPPLLDLDSNPRPDRSIFEIERYLAYDYETVVMTARGCPSRCTFCSTTQSGRRFRWHSVDRICEEVAEVLEMGFSSIFFGDDTFSGHSQRTIEFCKEVISRSLDFPWTSNMRMTDAKPPVLEAIRSAGGYRVFMGFESIQPETLKLVKKGTTPERLYSTAQVVKEHDIELHAAFIIGAPGDTHESLEATLDFIRLVDPTVATFNVMEPRPGTDVYSHPEKYGIHIPDPYWYEKSEWLDLPVCYSDTLTQEEIKTWVSRCYDEFCSPDFRSPEKLNRLAPTLEMLNPLDSKSSSKLSSINKELLLPLLG